jgi:hypothetical protein
MRFHLDRFPENTNFNPEAEGWFALPTGKINTVHLKTLPVSLGLFLLWLTLLSFVFPSESLTPQVTQLFPNVIRIQYPIFQTPLWPLLPILIAISILFIPTHEEIHALCCPQWGLSANTVFGICLHKGFFYIHHEGPMSRNHFLLVLVAPYIVLSLLPLAAIGLFRAIGWTPELLITLAWLSLLGSLFAGGDFISVGSLLSRVPNAAIVRNKGKRSYWKPADKTPRTV